MSRAEKLQEVKDLKETIAKYGPSRDIQRRIDWLMNNLDTKPSKEAKRIASEFKNTMDSKTTRYTI